MRRKKNNLMPVACAMLWLFVIGGCASSPPQNFYKLGAGSAPEPRAGVASYSVAVGPATVPMLVDRPQIVLNAGPNRVTLAEQSRWAEPLKESIPRVIAADLSRLLPDAYVAAYPQTTLVRPDYYVLVDVLRFESEQGKAATIELLWAVSAGRSGSRTTGRTFRQEPASGNGYEALVAAHERALAAVSREIAAVVMKEKSKPEARR